MKKIITAKEQWTSEQKKLEDKGYHYEKCCEDLGAINDNAFYHFFSEGVDYFFYKYDTAYGMLECTSATASDLLLNNWRELNPKDSWYDKAKLAEFLIRKAQGEDVVSPIPLEELLWMDIFDSSVKETVFLDKEIEVSTEEIEAIRKEIVELCKGHSAKEVRDMFKGYNFDAKGENTYDFLYEGFVFNIKDEEECSFLSGCVYGKDGTDYGYVGEEITLPIPPKEIKLDMSDIVDEKPDLSDWGMTISYDYIVQRMRESCICRISDIYQKIGEKYVEIDTVTWLETHGSFADYQDYYNVALTRNSKGDVVLTGTDTAEWDEYMTANDWSFVSLEEMLYIINQLTSK